MGGVNGDTLHNSARLRRQPQRPVPLLERGPLGAELQLAQERLQRQRSARSRRQLLSSFSLDLHRGSFFFQRRQPSANHFSNFR